MEKEQIIVYVDDDEDDLMLLREAFDKVTEYRLVCLPGGHDLLALLQRKDIKVCLIILDINMPLMSGTDILLELKTREEYKFIPIVMLSTNRSPKENAIVEAFGCEIVIKPTSYSEMTTLAARLIAYC